MAAYLAPLSAILPLFGIPVSAALAAPAVLLHAGGMIADGAAVPLWLLQAALALSVWAHYAWVGESGDRRRIASLRETLQDMYSSVCVLREQLGSRSPVPMPAGHAELPAARLAKMSDVLVVQARASGADLGRLQKIAAAHGLGLAASRAAPMRDYADFAAAAGPLEEIILGREARRPGPPPGAGPGGRA